MLNVYSDCKFGTFVEAGKEFEEEMYLWWLQQVKIARVTKQRATAAFQKFAIAAFFGPFG